MIRMDSAPTPRGRLFLLPLMDVLCFLLAVFVLFTLSMNRAQFPASVRVPAAEVAGCALGPANPVMVVVEQDGTCTLDNLRVEGGARQLVAILVGSRFREPDLHVVIAADERVPFAMIAPVLNGLKREGFRWVTLETRRALPRS